jgi:hypothetical protein
MTLTCLTIRRLCPTIEATLDHHPSSAHLITNPSGHCPLVQWWRPLSTSMRGRSAFGYRCATASARVRLSTTEPVVARVGSDGSGLGVKGFAASRLPD